MSEKEQIDAFADALDRLVKRFVDEYDLPAAAVIGTLQFKQFTLMLNHWSDHNKDDDADE